MQSDLKAYLIKDGMDSYIEWHRRILKLGRYSIYKVEGKFKFYLQLDGRRW